MLYERQKALLALVDELGGRVPGTDLQKLLFLWMRDAQNGEPLFDFVPYRFGAFSFTSYADRRKLIEKGFLVEEEKDWAITETGKAAIVKETKVRARASAFAAKAPKVRGDRLVAMTYRRYPFFAIRSEIATQVLGDDPRILEQITAARPTVGPAGIATIGYEGRSLEGYLVLLMKAGVTMLCDVRRNPISRRYGFAKSTLGRACEGVGIRYEHLPELGIASSERRGLENQSDYDELFDHYERDSLPQQTAALSKIAAWVGAGERIALTCFELQPQRCHRHCVAEALEQEYGRPFAPTHI